jgi:hypothetical protein
MDDPLLAMPSLFGPCHTLEISLHFLPMIGFIEA